MKIKLGSQAQDKITGFKGIVIGYVIYVTGCNQYCIKPKVDKEGKIQEGEWFDEGTVELIGKGILEKEVKGETKGGPQSDAPKR